MSSIIHRFLLFWGMALALLMASSTTTTATTHAFTPISVSSRTRSTSTSSLSASTLLQSSPPQLQQPQQQQHRDNNIVMMPAVIEKEKTTRRTSDGNSITIERPVTERVDQTDQSKERQSNGSQGWEVRIYNDGINTREYVARSLVQITGMSEMAAYQTMMTAHQNGLAVVGRWVYEVAEMYHDALRKSGIVCDLVPVEDDN